MVDYGSTLARRARSISLGLGEILYFVFGPYPLLLEVSAGEKNEANCHLTCECISKFYDMNFRRFLA